MKRIKKKENTLNFLNKLSMKGATNSLLLRIRNNILFGLEPIWEGGTEE